MLHLISGAGGGGGGGVVRVCVCGGGGRGVNLPSPLVAFFNIHVKTYSPHTDISHVGGHLACGLLFI